MEKSVNMCEGCRTYIRLQVSEEDEQNGMKQYLTDNSWETLPN